MTLITKSGVAVQVPAGWEGELQYHLGQRVVLHLTDGPLPGARSDFGGHALEQLGSGRLFIAMLEYDPKEANQGLFRTVGLPALVPGEFAPNKLHRYVKGQSAGQRFFSLGERSFCIYVVLASQSATTQEVARVNQVIQGIEISSFR